MPYDKAKYFASMRKKLGVDTDDEVRAYFRAAGDKAKRTRVGGFHKLKQTDPDKLKELSRAAANKRWKNEA